MDNNILKEIWDKKIPKILCYLKPSENPVILNEFKGSSAYSAKFYFNTPRKFTVDYTSMVMAWRDLNMDYQYIDIRVEFFINLHFKLKEKYLPKNSLLAYGIYITGDKVVFHYGEDCVLTTRNSPYFNSAKLVKAVIESKQLWNSN